MLKKHPCIPRPLGSGVSVPDFVQVYALFVACRAGAYSRRLSNTASAAAVMAPRTIIALCFTEVFVISDFDANQSYTGGSKIRAGLFSPPGAVSSPSSPWLKRFRSGLNGSRFQLNNENRNLQRQRHQRTPELLALDMRVLLPATTTPCRVRRPWWKRRATRAGLD